MKPEALSLALLRRANPVGLEPAAGRSAHARALFERIIREPRLAGDGRPRRRGTPSLDGLRLRSRLVVGGAGISAAAAAIILLLSGSSVTPAFAGWTASPTVAGKQQVTAAIHRCGLTGPLLVDARGPYTAAVFASASGGSACIIGPGGMLDVGSVGGVVAPDNRFRPDQIGVAVITGADSEGHTFILLTGRVGSAVRTVVIHRADHTDVIASVKHGWYLAWWPASTAATDATVTTTHGTHNVALPALAKQTASCGPAVHTRVLDGKHLTDACASSGPGSNGPGSDGVLGPPLIGGPLAKPFHGTLLINVWNEASRVLVCFHPPALSVAGQIDGPTGPCTAARLLTRLPPKYPVQSNLLRVFPKGVWEITLPNGNRKHGTLTFLVLAYNSFRYGQQRTELTVTW